jgi:hypothetical protein
VHANFSSIAVAGLGQEERRTRPTPTDGLWFVEPYGIRKGMNRNFVLIYGGLLQVDTFTAERYFPNHYALQVVLRGFMNISVPTWMRRLLTRGAAVLPAALLQALGGDRLSYRWVVC